jgi:hypothetical protein
VGLLRHFGALPAASEVSVEELPDLMRAERLCTALEEFRAICPSSEIDVERVVILIKELVRGELIRVTTCSMHRELVVHDCLVAREPDTADGMTRKSAALTATTRGSVQAALSDAYEHGRVQPLSLANGRSTPVNCRCNSLLPQLR